MSDDEPKHQLGRSVTIDHAAQLLGICRRSVYNRIKDGRLQTIRAGVSQRVLVESIALPINRRSVNQRLLMPGEGHR